VICCLEGWDPIAQTGPLSGLSASRLQHPQRLLDRSRAIGEEHQAELTDHRVVAGIVEGELIGASVVPDDAGAEALREGDHARQGVDAPHLAVGPHAMQRSAGHDARTASQIEHVLLRPHLRGIEHAWGPFCHQRGNVKVLVGLRGRDGLG